MCSREASSRRGVWIKRCCLSAQLESAVSCWPKLYVEVEENLLLHAAALSTKDADVMLENYRRLIFRLTGLGNGREADYGWPSAAIGASARG